MASLINDSSMIDFEKDYGFQFVLPPTVYLHLKSFYHINSINKNQNDGDMFVDRFEEGIGEVGS